ncbi:head-tail connector protein [Pectobacterium polaris]|uniref:head-tail connector protein n=1 Tax=Pectobacterium polaris TaxID=2042057 RepID=UPI00158365F0|nr:head-tail connector protein [Pectobacterium polaris]
MIPSLEELRAQCRIDADDSSEDMLLTIYAESGRDKVEKYLNLPLFDTSVPEGADKGMVINARVKLAIMLAVGHWYENREQTREGQLSEIPMGFYSLLDDYRWRPGT